MSTKLDYASKVPFYTFPVSPKEQEVALKTNPLMQRLHEYRKRCINDPHRPIYHCVNPENTLNDPNGLCFWQAHWHQAKVSCAYFLTRVSSRFSSTVNRVWLSASIQTVMTASAFLCEHRAKRQR